MMQMFSSLKENPWRTLKVVGLVSTAVVAVYYCYRKGFLWIKPKPSAQEIQERQDLQHYYKNKLRSMVSVVDISLFTVF